MVIDARYLEVRFDLMHPDDDSEPVDSIRGYLPSLVERIDVNVPERSLQIHYRVPLRTRKNMPTAATDGGQRLVIVTPS